MDHIQQKDWHSSLILVVLISEVSMEVSPKTSQLSQYFSIFPEASLLSTHLKENQN